MFDNNKLRVEGINSKGFGTIPKLLMQDRNLHITSKAIYAYLCSYAGGGETCFPTRNKVCFDLNISKDTFGKYLKELIKFGYIRCEQIKENGKFSHNVYTLCSEITVSENTVYGNFVSDSLDTNINNNKNNNNKNNNIIFKEKYKKENFESDTITNNFQNLPVEDMKKEVPKKAPLKEIEISFGDIIEPPKENINTGKVSKEELTKIEKLDKKTKHKYGEYQNVLLTDEELAKLKTEFPNDFEIRIEQLSEYIEIKAPKYKNHLAVIRAWARKDAEKIKAIEANYSFSVEKYENDEPDFDALNRMLERHPKRRT